ncbi:MAG: hypothetical protein WD095_01530, partial [Candidatus Paceibacterota bacterium]
MLKKKTRKRKTKRRSNRTKDLKTRWLEYIHPEIKKSVWVVSFLAIAIVFILASAGQAGPVGENFYNFFHSLLGVGYYLLPIASFILAFSFVDPDKDRVLSLTLVGVFVFVIAGLGIIDIVSPGSAGSFGSIVGSLSSP